MYSKEESYGLAKDVPTIKRRRKLVIQINDSRFHAHPSMRKH